LKMVGFRGRELLAVSNQRPATVRMQMHFGHGMPESPSVTRLFLRLFRGADQSSVFIQDFSYLGISQNGVHQ
jgi:hypothetical protein